MAKSYIKIDGSWKGIRKLHLKQADAWTPVKKGFIHSDGAWNLFFQNRIVIEVSSWFNDFNLYDAVVEQLGTAPTAAIDVLLHIYDKSYYRKGVIAATTTANAALTIGQFPAGSDITVMNYGHIYGAAGVASGERGGDAIFADFPNQTVAIYNGIDSNDGFIYAGGGAGGQGGAGGLGGVGSGITQLEFAPDEPDETRIVHVWEGGAGGAGGAGGLGGSGMGSGGAPGAGGMGLPGASGGLGERMDYTTGAGDGGQGGQGGRGGRGGTHGKPGAMGEHGNAGSDGEGVYFNGKKGAADPDGPGFPGFPGSAGGAAGNYLVKGTASVTFINYLDWHVEGGLA